MMSTQLNITNNYYYPYNLATTSVSHGNSGQKPLTAKQKTLIAGSAVLGIVPAFAAVAAKRGFSLSPSKIFKTPMKDWALFKYAPKEKAIDFNPGTILAIASGSIAGGFIGGVLVDDKSNLKAKKREVLNQILGNVAVPVACVWAGSKIYNKFADKIEGAMPQFKNPKGKVKPFLNALSKKLPNVSGMLLFLSAGIFAGNRVSNMINDSLYNRKVERKIRPTDFAPHVDDLCMATTMMNKSSNFGSKIGRIIPLALIIPGYETGIARNN